MQLSTQSLCSAQIPNPLINFCSSYLSSLIIYSKSCSTHPYFPSLALKSIPTKQLQCNVIRPRKQRNPGAIFASEAETTAAAAATTTTTNDAAERWLLQPVGDGDSRHIGFKVSMPAAFEIASSVVTVGRLPEKADIVIPVATVSGTHARIEKKDGVLLVTDLDSTNGTFIGEKRLTPGVTVPISSGSYITFGDTNLAIFRVSKLENIEVSSKSEEQSEAKAESEEPK